MPGIYDIPVDDPKLLATVAYLEGLGAPAPVITRNVYAYPGGGEVAETFATFAGKIEIAALMVMAPNVTANWLGEEGVMPVHPGLSDTAPIPTVTPIVPVAKPIALSPIGGRQESTEPAVGDHYWLSSGWHFNAGTTWKENGMEFLLHETPSPFGLSDVYWERTK